MFYTLCLGLLHSGWWFFWIQNKILVVDGAFATQDSLNWFVLDILDDMTIPMNGLLPGVGREAFWGGLDKGWHCLGIQHTQPGREHVCWLHLRFAMAISAKDKILAKYSTFAMAILASSPVVAFPFSILCRFPKGFSASASLGFLWGDPSFDFFTEKLMEPSPKPCQVLEQLVQQLVRRVGEASLASFDLLGPKFGMIFNSHLKILNFLMLICCGFPSNLKPLWPLTPSSSSAQASPEMCFDALNPFVTAEHFNQLLTSRRWALGSVGSVPPKNQGWVRWRIGHKTGSLYPSHFCWFLLLQCANCCFITCSTRRN